jgi:hypothetical protein
MAPIHINIYMAIYNQFIKGTRYRLTEKIFRHYKHIQMIFKDRIRFTFTIQGSEKDFSKNLVLEYFDRNSYIEYDQNGVCIGHREFWTMLRKKINIGFRQATATNPDISFWAGSNDYVSINFFEQVLAHYKEDVPQVYGIDKYQNGNNITCIFKHGPEKLDILDDKNEAIFWWTGDELHSNRRQFKYIGAIIGLNKKCYTMYPDVLYKWGYDEGVNIKNILDKGNIDVLNTRDIIFLNPKIDSRSDITNFNLLKKHILSSKIDITALPPELRERMKQEYDRFMSL